MRRKPWECTTKKRRIARNWPAVLLVSLLLAPAAMAERTKLKPGFNVFSPQQDVEVGQQVSRDAESKLPMLNDRRVDEYLNRLGQRLASKAPGERYPYQFKAVNDPAINAFALPGGFLYVNRGTIDAADNEAQLAGVMGHEIGHVALRHGTNQASKAYALQVPLAVLGGVVGSNSIGGILAQVGAGFAAESVLLKYSRDAERQADIIGTQILYDNGYEPTEMANFFEKLNKESGGKRGVEFFSSHPNPENRIQNVTAEVRKMGGDLGRYTNDSEEFRAIQRYVRSLPAPPKAAVGAVRPSGARSDGRIVKPQPPSGRYRDHRTASLSLRYPDNWVVTGGEEAFTLLPEGGAVADANGNASLAYGMIMAVFQPNPDQSGQVDLEPATQQLLASLRRDNPDLSAARQSASIRVSGRRALSLTLSNRSPVGGNEVDWLVTILRPEGLVYFVFVAPESEFAQYQRTFEDMLRSIQFSGR